MSISINIKQRNKPNSKGEYPIVIQIIKDRKAKIISTGYLCSKEEWDKQLSQFNKKCINYSKKNRVLMKLKEKAFSVIDDFALMQVDFTLQQFEQKFRGVEVAKKSVSQFWLEKIEELENSGRMGNAKAYKDTYRSFFKFNSLKNIEFKNIDPDLLSKYESFLRSTGSNDGGIGLKMREIRALYNDAINRGFAKQEHYPFKTFKLSKFRGSGTKDTLSKQEIEKFEQLNKEENMHLLNTYNYFIFSYYARGMNFADLMTLKWSDINGDRINYNRAKTKTKFSISINSPMRKILDYYKDVDDSSTKYIFPILLKNEMTPKQIANRKSKVLKQYNKKLKQIASIQGIDKNITSYVARHSFATNLKFSGVSTDIISQIMGHSDIKVTQAYLRDFGDEELDDAVDRLLEEPMLKYAS